MSLLDEICHLAKTKDTSALTRKINEEKICIDVQQGVYTPVMLLAQQKKEDAVTFLISRFNANRDYAVRGYAAGGHTARVDALLALGANRDYAVWGYAAGGHTANSEKLLRLMTLTNDLALRNELAKKAQHNTSTALLKKANGLSRLMKENHMSYPWARVWKPELQGLFLLGAALLQEKARINDTTTVRPALNFHVLLHISSYLSGLSNEVTFAFLNRHTKPTKKDQPYKMGKHTLFMREKALISHEPHMLFLSKTELTTILADYQSTSYFSKLSKVFNFSAIKKLETLLASEKNAFSYEDILQATRSHLNQLDNPSIQNGTKEVLKAIQSKFDAQVTKQVVGFK